jgi:hypothetical protein
MRFESVRKILLDPHHLGRLITEHRAAHIAPHAEGAIEPWNRHVSIGKAQRDAVLEQKIPRQMKPMVLAKDDPAVVAIFPHTSPRLGSPGWAGTAVARMISIQNR